MATFNPPTNVINKTSIEQKKREVLAAHRIKFGSPQLRNMLREKCRIQIKKARSIAHNGCRRIPTDCTSFVQSIVKAELVELEHDIELHDQIYKELIEEANQWLLEDIELEEDYLTEYLGNDKPFVCPICQVASLQVEECTIVCSCGLKFSCTKRLSELHDEVVAIVCGHEKTCSNPLNFFTEPSLYNAELQSLNALCDACDFYYTIIH